MTVLTQTPITEETYETLASSLLDPQAPLSSRFRALFTLKSIPTPQAVDIIAQGFQDPSVLLKHELAYVLGQMKHTHAIPYLTHILSTMEEDPMVRHEAAEALGAIGHPESLPVLESFKSDESVVVRETCEIAIDRINYEIKKKEQPEEEKFYSSVDPAPAMNIQEITTEELSQTLLDTSLPLFQRYRAMFSLRNRGDREAVLALAQGLKDPSALFRHEIAYVFGQLQSPHSVPALIESLSDSNEEAMVRHEAAEALGSIATEECMPVLAKFSQDPERVVRESCVIGLDMYEYENSGEFQYAQPLVQPEDK